MTKFVALFVFALAIAVAVAQQDPTQATKSDPPTTQAPAPKTDAPTTQAPKTDAPTTQAPKTDAPTTQAHTTTPPKVVTTVTTEAPTTEAPTTQAPTTHEPTSTVTQQATTEAPAPTLPPTPPVVSFNDTNSTCIMMKMAARFHVYYPADNETEDTTFDLPMDTKWVAECGTNTTTQTLMGTFDKNELTFTFTQKGGNFELSEIQLVFSAPGVISAPYTFNASNLALFSATQGNSYMCNSDQEQKFNDDKSSVTMSKVQIQAFHTATDPGVFGTIQECPADSKTGNIVPIAVGAALAALVVIVLIAYLISRSRNQTGYESV